MMMNKPIFNYILLLSLLLLSSCARNTYDWVKINPDKIGLAKTAKPYSENIRYVEVLVNAKYKTENIVYVENSAEYFSTNKTISSVKPKTALATNRKVVKTNHSIQIISSEKKVVKAPALQAKVSANVQSQPQPKEVIIEDAEAMSRLNRGLKMPKKRRLIAENNIRIENSESRKQDLELNSSRVVKDSSLQATSDNQLQEEGAKRNSYMWLGLVLLIVGLIIGLIYGRFAYFISIVGVVFLVIGYVSQT